MPNLPEVLTSDSRKSAVIEDCLALIDAEVQDKGGLSGLAIKAGYKAVQGVKPGFVRQVVIDLLPEFALALDPCSKRRSLPVARSKSTSTPTRPGWPTLF